MEVYPLRFEPIYREKIWGGRSLERLFGRSLPPGAKIGESWELADLPQGTSRVANGPLAGQTLTAVTAGMGRSLLGSAEPEPAGRFPLLLKFLDAADVLSLQVHPDAEAARRIGPEAAPKTECWHVVQSRAGAIYKGVRPGVTAEQFRRAIQADSVADLVRRLEVEAGDFHYLPAGTVHALGAGILVAEVQTSSDTTYRVTDWGRGREIHVEKSMQCIRFEPTDDRPPGASGETLLVTGPFAVARRTRRREQPLPAGRCTALMILGGDDAELRHAGDTEPAVRLRAGDTVLLPAATERPTLASAGETTWLEITVPGR